MKKPKLSREALEAYKALRHLSEEEHKLVLRKVSQLEPAETVQEQPKEKENCPHCGSSHVSRYGNTPAGYQRLICVDCRKTFGAKERPVSIRSDFPKEVWIEYMRLMKAGATLKDLAEALKINVTTAFYLQKVNKLHSAFKQDLARFNGVSTKYLENYANLTISKQETPSISGIARVTLLVEKLSNVPRVARWKELGRPDYPSFVYEVLYMDCTSEKEVST